MNMFYESIAAYYQENIGFQERQNNDRRYALHMYSGENRYQLLELDLSL